MHGYDLLGRLTSAATSAQTLGFTYDALGRRLSEAGPVRTVYSAWDEAGRRQYVVADGHYAVRFAWLVTGELSALQNGSFDPMVTFAYDDLGRRTATAAFDGTTSSRSYDAAGRLTGLALDLPSSGNDVTFGYSYNPAGEIVSNTRSNDAYSFTLANANVASTANGLNQLTAIGGASVTHDARGNVTAIGSTGYGYYAENRMSVATAISGGYLAFDPVGRLSFIYNPADGSGTTARQYSSHELVQERTMGGAIRRRYVFGAGVDEPLVWYEGSGLSDRRWLHADERGSVIAASDGSGNLVGSINRYDDYGAAQGGSITGRFGYTGQAWLPELGLYDYRARFYNPALGRFMQTDPIGYGGGMNLYAYVGNNPVNRTDPSGLEDLTLSPRVTVIGPRWMDYLRQLHEQMIMRIELRQLQERLTRGDDGVEEQNVVVEGRRPPKPRPLPVRLPPSPLATCSTGLEFLSFDQANDNFRTRHPICTTLTYSCLVNARTGGAGAAACRTAGRVCDLAFVASIVAPQTFGRTDVQWPDGTLLEIKVGVFIIRRWGRPF